MIRAAMNILATAGFVLGALLAAVGFRAVALYEDRLTVGVACIAAALLTWSATTASGRRLHSLADRRAQAGSRA